MSAYDNGAYGFGKRERRGRRSELPDDVAKKLKSCSVMGCEEWRDLTAHTTYHCFPTGEKNQARWEIWTSLLQKARDDPSWIPFRGSLVCSHHFRNLDFVHDPNQKRTKLVKNAIPSIFPSFQVDLDDPDFVLEDNQEYEEMDGDDNNGFADDMADYSNQNSYDEYDDQYQEYEYDQQNDEHDIEMPIPEVHYDEEPTEESEIIYANREHPRPPKLIPAAKASARSQELYSDEPPRKKPFTGNVNPPALKKTPVLVKGGNVQSGSLKAEGSSNSVAKSSSMTSKISSKSKLYEQLCKSTSDGNGTSKTPFSWNPDLEIEVLNPSSPSDEADSLRQRIEELENEQEALKNKYENQIRALQRKVRDQDRIINEYAVQMNSLKRQRPT